MNANDLRAFEEEVAAAFKAKQIRGPVHLSGGNEDQLIEIFKQISPSDYVLSTYRSHYHALLHGVARHRVMNEILAGRSMNLCFPEHRFYTSAIVGGMLPIAVGIAAGLKRSEAPGCVWCFVGDMAATTGAWREATQYGGNLPVTFVVEDNALSCDSPTDDCWGERRVNPCQVMHYPYKRRYPHVGVGQFVQF